MVSELRRWKEGSTVASDAFMWVGGWPRASTFSCAFTFALVACGGWGRGDDDPEISEADNVTGSDGRWSMPEGSHTLGESFMEKVGTGGVVP